MNIQHLPTSEIVIHKLLENVPQLAARSNDMEMLIASVRERGIDQPLIVCTPQGEDSTFFWLIDGRHRLRAAKEAGLESVPVIVRDDVEPIEIIISSLVERRHMSKSAMAYILFPLLKKATLGHGGNRGNQYQKVAKSTEWTLPNSQQLANRSGFGRTLYFQAAELHELLETHSDDRERVEELIFTHGISLGDVLKQIKGGLLSPEGAELVDKRRQYDRLALEFFHKTTHHILQGWDGFDDRQRLAVKRSLIDEAAKWPDDLRQSLADSLKKARRSE